VSRKYQRKLSVVFVWFVILSSPLIKIDFIYSLSLRIMHIRFVQFFFLIVLISGSFSCSRIPMRESSTQMLLNLPGARFEYMEHEGRTLRYMNLHRHDSLPTVLFLHGSPSTMSVYNVYYRDTLFRQWANIIAADRPGYGFSGMGLSEKSVERQAEYMWKILENEGFPSPLYIIGSSYGGTVATKMAMLKPEKVDGLLLVSASLAPGEERTYPISYLIRYQPLRWLVPRMVMVANDEKLSHYQALDQMLPFWERIVTPVVLIQGTADRLIYPSNSNFARERLLNSAYIDYHLLEGEGHFLQIRYKDFILERLRYLMDLRLDTLGKKLNEMAN
jgi:pimeloyl-ACP methyl ester carboxylesterase